MNPINHLDLRRNRVICYQKTHKKVTEKQYNSQLHAFILMWVLKYGTNLPKWSIWRGKLLIGFLYYSYGQPKSFVVYKQDRKGIVEYYSFPCLATHYLLFDIGYG